MSRRRGRGHKGGHEEGHADERWLVSYADMITVLMCLFLVLFAMSSIDADKYAQLKDSLATGFGTTPSDDVDAAIGVIVEPEYVSEEGVGFTSDVTDESSLEKAKDEVAQFQEIIDAITANLTAQGAQDQVSFAVDQRGLTIKLVGGQAYFAGDSADLEPAAHATIAAIGAGVAGIPNLVSVEGHVDPYGRGTPSAADWYLAGDRSTAVLRELVDNNYVPGAHISAVSFGGYHPVVAEKSGQNRRVDIVVLTDLDAESAALIPSVVDGSADTLATTGQKTGTSTGNH